MKTIKNAIHAWLLVVKETKDAGEIATWWTLTSLMIAIVIGFSFLIWFYSIFALFLGIIVFIPGIFVLYSKFSDMKIDARIAELKTLLEKEKNTRCSY